MNFDKKNSGYLHESDLRPKKTRNITGYTRKRKVDKEKRKRQVFLSLDVSKCNSIFHFVGENKKKKEGITDIA